MGNIGAGLFWVVFFFVSWKIVTWVWPLVEALVAAGLVLVGWAIGGFVVLILLWVVGKVMGSFI